MNSPITPTTRSNSLAGLMKFSDASQADWSPAELGAILRHQLSAPLEYDLRTIAPGGQRAIDQMTAAISTGPRPKNFADLIAHPNPPLDLLTLMKDFSRAGRENGTLPPEVGTSLYYVAILLAQFRCNTRITQLDDAALRKGLQWTASLPWLTDEMKKIVNEGLAALG